MKNKFALSFILTVLCQHFLVAQLPYTQKLYPVSIEKDIPYGTATTSAGGTENLELDLYKPVGDDNCRRPLLVMAHGGGFIGGTKDNYDVVQICEEMAARGYVTASIHYRLGMNPTSYYEPYAFCNDWLNPIGISKCIYMADSMEMPRALYRASQDMKGAIRFLKGRHSLDSTDVGNVFVGGSSAGAITALNTAFMDLPSEKLPFTTALADAPVPDSDVASCVPAPANRSRPDLGGTEGDQNLNSHDSSVKGVADFMGGLFDLGLLAGPDTPAIYLYHRTDDLVVPSNTERLFLLYPYCLNPINLCQPLSVRPMIHGSASIKAKLESMGSAAPPFFNDILTGYGPADGDDCLDDPPGHSIDNIPLRCVNLSGFFAPIIAANGNSPSVNCVSGTDFTQNKKRLKVYPNPVQGGVLHIACGNCPSDQATFRLLDVTGRTVAETVGNHLDSSWELPGIPDGVYFLQVFSKDLNEVRRVVF
ncbi:MAG: T9SS type A sorting domain-containing protein [Saprospiraceae bacterium]|nr:T9SS type A sorting domain-containing protein [Saprospiraceae bacterium]MCF8249583.1 T9SS type A sorting domain-containing protein [Saprospiraceae bacterium]MCF8280483.1 T9SS type A sorting domain-containing protein [Bacteroidales bacterium]MCF8310415.1 T9SS type A sorting domain-containing protein [Saprospiraceae bacterium]MCF8439793.1 T9SS type A sorting domain-containing protein [Saprospiraceae bacterium]